MKKKKLLITGGTGSLGKTLIKQLKSKYDVSIYSRDEGKQANINSDIHKVVGDIRDSENLNATLKYIKPDYVVHAAALKRVDDMEIYPYECVKTNIIGSINVIQACNKNLVKKCILISTDKACSPINVYGASKFIGERLFTNADYTSADTVFSSCRYGNVIASRGSFIEIWHKKILDDLPISITDETCTRFLFSLDEASEFVINCLERSEGGEVFVPLLKSFKIIDLIKILENITQKKVKYTVSGLRPGEKIHEELLNEHEIKYTFVEKDILVILPQYGTHHYTYATKWNGSAWNSGDHISTDYEHLTNIIKEIICPLL